MGLMHAFVSPHQKKLKDLKTHEKLKISHLEAKFTIYKKKSKNSREKLKVLANPLGKLLEHRSKKAWVNDMLKNSTDLRIPSW